MGSCALVGLKPGRQDADLIVGSSYVVHVDRWDYLFLVDADLVVGIQAWSLDDLTAIHVDRWVHLFLFDASPVV